MTTDSVKTCKQCGNSKPLVDFYGKSRQDLYPSSSAGVSSRCKDCDRERRREYVAAYPDRARLAWRKARYAKAFGITIEQYNAMFTAQEGCCAICGDHQSKRTRSFAVDHDHAAGNVRGLLCTQCNTALGKFKEDPKILREAIRYLEEHSQPSVGDPRTGGSDQRGSTSTLRPVGLVN